MSQLTIPQPHLPAFARRSDDELWGRAVGYSSAVHGLIFLLLALSAYQREKKPVAFLNNVTYVERAAPAPEAPARITEVESGTGSGMAGATNARSDEASSRENMPYTGISSPRGSADGSVVSAQPMAGPIITGAPVGAIGRQPGALKEIAGRTAGKPGNGLMMPFDTKGSPSKAVSLSKVDVDSIRGKEVGAGMPMVSNQAISDSLGGRARQIVAAPGMERKKMAVEDLKSNPLDKDKWGKQKGPFSIEGPLKYRKILKMELPPYPRWAEEKGVETSVSVRLWVDPKGKVRENMYLEKTSGYSELDQLAMEALKRFMFVAMPADLAQEDEWGVATFRFELRK